LFLSLFYFQTMKRYIIIIGALILAGGCSKNKSSNPEFLKSQLENYLEARSAKDNSHWQYTTDTVTTWFDEKTGEGRKSIKGAQSSGPWAQWDKEMNSYSTHDDNFTVNENDHSVTGVFYEHNDFYDLLGKGPTKSTRTYWFNKDGLINEVLIVWDPSNSLTSVYLDSVVVWELKYDSLEITQLYANEEITPSVENAKRWKALLKKYNERN